MFTDQNSSSRAASGAGPKSGSPSCKAEPGTIVPVVDARRCEGKSDCVAVCPHGVFEIGPIRDEVFAAMPLPVKLKLWFHGKRTAYTPNADACRACGLCVAACPEHAIRLERHGEQSAPAASRQP